MPFHLLSLPPELRIKIYMAALVSPQPLILAPYRSLLRKWLPTTPLLRTCRQISTEATPLLYTHNKFHFLSSRAYNSLYYFLSLIGPQNRSYIRNVGMPWPVMQPVLEMMVEPGGEMAAAHRFDARPVVAGALGLLVEGARREVRLNIYHRRCTRDMQADGGEVLTCSDACTAAVHFLHGLPLRKVFHASPLEQWSSDDPHCTLMIGLMRDRGWDIQLYEDNCLDPSAEPALTWGGCGTDPKSFGVKWSQPW